MDSTHRGTRDRYTAVARRCADTYLTRYSTSFSLACRLLAPATRPHVTAVYAWARIADEVVDGAVPGHEPGDDDGRAGELLQRLRRETSEALATGYSTNPVVHAFADTARRHGITQRLTEPFFDSMAADLEITDHSHESLRRYVYGSAEVIGEMCVRTFAGGSLAEDPEAAAGARALGSAFQRVNFLRDVAEDHGVLGRNYLPGRDPVTLDDADVAELADEVDAELRAARATVDLIPGRDRLAVLVAHDLFAELNRRLRAAGGHRVRTGRVRVPDPIKLQIVARAVATPRGAAPAGVRS